MILRRVMEHVKAQNWLAVAIDFVIVVVGVFIGLQVQDWSKRQEDRRREIQIVADLLADLSMDRPQYAEGLAFDKRRVSAANASLEGAGLPAIGFESATQNAGVVDYSFDLSEASGLPAARRDRLWTDLVIGFHPTPSTSTYDAMVGAGDIKIIRDREIVREIQLYRNRTSTVQIQNEKLLSIRENLMNLGAAHGLAPFADLSPEDYFAIVAREPGLAAAIRVQATFSIFHHGEIEAADEQAATLQDRLGAYLEDAR